MAHTDDAPLPSQAFAAGAASPGLPLAPVSPGVLPTGLGGLLRRSPGSLPPDPAPAAPHPQTRSAPCRPGRRASRSADLSRCPRLRFQGTLPGTVPAAPTPAASGLLGSPETSEDSGSRRPAVLPRKQSAIGDPGPPSPASRGVCARPDTRFTRCPTREAPFVRSRGVPAVRFTVPSPRGEACVRPGPRAPGTIRARALARRRGRGWHRAAEVAGRPRSLPCSPRTGTESFARITRTCGSPGPELGAALGH
ncbi:serine/arginine repetitive matrix protein 3-like [Meles meles]|uniref:serine/arginine repetitive matrix protein 3-like n=1 Tax=Meles meles TaxID=9662 RepID=UPI001E69FAB3|nr:serine/arginine repetitive matrix protein 3-like [Meles meles]